MLPQDLTTHFTAMVIGLNMVPRKDQVGSMVLNTLPSLIPVVPFAAYIATKCQAQVIRIHIPVIRLPHLIPSMVIVRISHILRFIEVYRPYYPLHIKVEDTSILEYLNHGPIVQGSMDCMVPMLRWGLWREEPPLLGKSKEVSKVNQVSGHDYSERCMVRLVGIHDMEIIENYPEHTGADSNLSQ